MSNLLEFLVRLNNQAEGPLKQFANTGKKSFNDLSQSMNKMQGQFNKLGMNISQIDVKLNALKKTREISFDSSQIKRINGEIDQLQRKKDKLEGGKSGGGLFGNLLGAGLGFGAFSLGKSIMEKGMGRQMDLTALQTLVGNDAGTTLNNQLLKFAKESIYGNEVFNEGKLLAGSGVKAGNVMPVLSMIGDLAMGKKDRMQSLALAFAEASSTGHLNGRTELMMRTALFNPLESMSKMTGKSVAELEKNMRKGGISIDMLVKSMEYATGPMGRWHDMMKKMQETPAGKWTAFMGTIDTLEGTIGLKLLPVLGKLADFMTGILNSDKLKNIATAIGAMAVAWGVYSAAANWAAISSAAAEVAAMWPIAAVGAIGYAFSEINDYYKSYGNSLDDLSNKNNALANSTSEMVERISGSFNFLAHWWDSEKLAFETPILTIESLLERFKNGFTNKAGAIGFAPAFGAPTRADSVLDKLTAEYMWKIGDHQVGAPKKMSAFWLKHHKQYDDEKESSGKSAADIAGKYTPTGGSGALTDGSTAAAITGGGVRHITINVAKFQDKTEIHTANIKEGVHELEEMIRDMFLRVTNSAATAIS